jgi:hypothetical protein
LPCSISCWAKVCAFGGCCVPKNTASASPGTFVTIGEKSDVAVLTDSRCVVTPFAFRKACTASARPTEYGSCESTSTTFLTLSLSTM